MREQYMGKEGRRIKNGDKVDINSLPPVTPQEPRKGHWIDTNYHQYYNDGDIETTELRCSCCNEEVEWDIVLSHKPYYCENCGAKMVEPKESEKKK